MIGRGRTSMPDMTDALVKLRSWLLTYRQSLDEIFSAPPSTRSDCREYFSNLLLCLAQLYALSLMIARDLSETEIPGVRSEGLPISGNAGREHSLRIAFGARLASLRCWRYFDPEPVLPVRADLHVLEDYLNDFTLHLPEIHEETFRLEDYMNILLIVPLNMPLQV